MIIRTLTVAAFTLPALGLMRAPAPPVAPPRGPEAPEHLPTPPEPLPEPVLAPDPEPVVDEAPLPAPDELPGRWMKVTATAYSPHDACDSAYAASKGARWRWITADARTDVRKVPYGIAVSAGGLPYGTRVYIPLGQGYLDQSRPEPWDRVFIVDDTGSAITEAARRTGRIHLDLRFKHEASARLFGEKKIRVYVLNQETK